MWHVSYYNPALGKETEIVIGGRVGVFEFVLCSRLGRLKLRDQRMPTIVEGRYHRSVHIFTLLDYDRPPDIRSACGTGKADGVGMMSRADCWR
jgi:hypothetical protein